MDRWNRGPPTNIDEDFVGFQDLTIDHNSAGRLEAGMALNDSAILKSAQPVLHSLVRPSGNIILARFDTFHIDVHIASNRKTIFGASASNMGRVRTGNECLGRDTTRIHTCATELVAFDNGDGHARGRKPRSR